MKKFFQQYPNAKSYYEVGERIFLNHCKDEAELFAQQNGLKVEEIFPSTEEEVENIGEGVQLGDTILEPVKSNKTSTKKRKSSKKIIPDGIK